MPKINALIQKLSSRGSTNIVENQYNCSKKAKNLELYLRALG